MIRKLFNDEAGVSPIVATLVLVVVAIAGAAAVGTILGTFTGDVSDDAKTADASTSASREIIVAGSSTVQPVSEVLAKTYMKANPGVKVTVQAGGSDAGIASAGMGIIDVGAASKFMSEENKQKFPELQEHVIGGSAVVVFVNNKWTSAPTYVTKAQLDDLYDEQPNTSVTVGAATAGTGTEVYQRSESSGTEETFAVAVFGKTTKDVDKAANNAAITVVKTAIGNQALIDAVAASSAPAIGFADYGLVKSAIDSGKPLTILKIEYVDATANGVEVSSDNVKKAVKARLAGTEKTTDDSKTYPVELCRPLVYLTDGEPNSVVGHFVDFAMSPAAVE